MTEEQKTIEWQGDVIKDTITYRYIELSASLLELALVENKDLLKTYQNWLEGNKTKGEATPKSAILSEFSPEENTKIIVYSLSKANEFLAKFETPAFNVLVSFSYDFENQDVIATRLVHFKGEFNPAVSWAESVLKRIDDAFAKIEGND